MSKRRKFNISINDEVVTRLQLQAIKEKTKPSYIIERLVVEYLEKVEGTSKSENPDTE